MQEGADSKAQSAASTIATWLELPTSADSIDNDQAAAILGRMRDGEAG